MSKKILESSPTIEAFNDGLDELCSGHYMALLKADPTNLRLVEISEHGSGPDVSRRVWTIGTERNSLTDDWIFKYKLANSGVMRLWTVLYVRVGDECQLPKNSDHEIKHTLVRAASAADALETWKRTLFSVYCFGTVIDGDLFAESSVPKGSPPMCFERFYVSP